MSDLPDTIKYHLGDTVYHKTEPDKPGLVIKVCFFAGGHYYEVQWTRFASEFHYEFELQAEASYSTSNTSED